MTEETLCARCITRSAVVDCLNCVGGQGKDAFLPLCEECNQLIHQGFLQNHCVRSIAIKQSICQLTDQLQHFKLEKDYLEASLLEMKFIKTDLQEQEEAKILQIHKAVTEVHQSLKTFEEDLAKQVKEAAKEKVIKYEECEKVIQESIKEHDQIKGEVNAALNSDGTISLDIIKRMQEKMRTFDTKHFQQLYTSTLLPLTCVLGKPLDFAASIKLLTTPVESSDAGLSGADKHIQEQPGHKLSLFVESRMDGQSIFWASRDFSMEMTEELNELARKIREHLLLNAATNVFNVQEGSWCCARYEDNRWYRARVEKVKLDKKTAVVRWLDYAHNSEVPFGNIKELKQEFWTIPIQAVKCCLFEELEEDLPYDVRWHFSGITKDKTLDSTVIKVIHKEGEIPTMLVDVSLREDPGVDIKEQLNKKVIELKNKKKDPIICRDFRFAQQTIDERSKQTAPEPIEKNTDIKQVMLENTDKKHPHSKQTMQDNTEEQTKGSQRASPQPFLEGILNEIEKPKEKAKKSDKAKKQNEKKKKSLEDIHKNEDKNGKSIVKKPKISEQPRSVEIDKWTSPPQHSVWPQKEEPADEIVNMNPNAHIFVPRNSPPEHHGIERPTGHPFVAPHAHDRHFLPVEPPTFADVLKSKQRLNRIVYPKIPEGIDRRIHDDNLWPHPRSGGDGHCDMQYYHPQVQPVVHGMHPQHQPYHPKTSDVLGPLFGHGDGSNQLHPPKDTNRQQTEPLVMVETDVCKYVNPECFPHEQSLSKSTLEAFNVGASLSESGLLIGQQDQGAVLKNVGGQLMSNVTPPLNFSTCQSKGRSDGRDRPEPQISILKKSGRCSPVGTDTGARIVVGAVLDVKIVTELNMDGSFWSVMVRNEKQQAKFLSMTNELSLSSDILSPVELHSGKIVAVSPEEGKWFRASVLKVSGDLVQARLVDLGQIVDVSHDQVKKLDSKFILYPFQAIECSISRPNFREFGSHSRQIFLQEAFEKKLKIKVEGVSGCLIYVTLLLNTANAADNNLNFRIWASELDMNKGITKDQRADIARSDTQMPETTMVSSSDTCAPVISAPMTGITISGAPISSAPVTSMADLGAILPAQNPMALLFSEPQPSTTIIGTIPSTMPIGFPVIPFIAATTPYQEVPPDLVMNDVVQETEDAVDKWPSPVTNEVPEKTTNGNKDNNNIDGIHDKVRERKFRGKTFGL
ncbi:uncharacterized protein LOC117119830 isoform X2 [Anneissia japonica]|uniref:uncharacterized protein LOC117119830 isoform X2 n=1 Tax=Anneissia japonica TaxID=1529436 RepID=UPI00142568CE|nr:uncharacterized protein LOC117119830 isoform X2 [Anneissia japonica]